MSREAFAEALHVSKETVSRIEAGTREPSSPECDRIAAACRVPRAFLDVGFAPLERPITEVEARLFQLEERIARERQELLAEVATLAGEAVARALESGRLPRGEGGDATETDSAAG